MIELLKEAEGRLKSINSTLETNYEPFKRIVKEYREYRKGKQLSELSKEEIKILETLDNMLERFEELY